MKHPPINRVRLQQENRAMRFTEADEDWEAGR